MDIRRIHHFCRSIQIDRYHRLRSHRSSEYMRRVWLLAIIVTLLEKRTRLCMLLTWCTPERYVVVNTSHIFMLTEIHQPPTNSPSDGTDFPSIVRTSLIRHGTHKASCSTCNKQSATFESRRSISNQDLPHILALNACVFSEDTHQYWRDGRRQTFLKPTLEMRGQINGRDESETVLYELRVGYIQCFSLFVHR